jgi:hypothetical protein
MGALVASQQQELATLRVQTPTLAAQALKGQGSDKPEDEVEEVQKSLRRTLE